MVTMNKRMNAKLQKWQWTKAWDKKTYKWVKNCKQIGVLQYHGATMQPCEPWTVSHKPIFYIKYFFNIIFHPHFILTFYQNKFHPNYMFLNFHLYFIPIVTTFTYSKLVPIFHPNQPWCRGWKYASWINKFYCFPHIHNVILVIIEWSFEP
jgi:hypothetical protein